jgi:hypothetical protein
MEFGGIMEENQQQVEQKVVEIRASMCQQCEHCKKRERYRVVPVVKDLPNPSIILLAESPLAVMVKEVRSPDHLYIIFKCQDPMCLLANAKQSIAQYWFTEQKRKMMTMQHQLAKKKRKTKKRKNNRKRA